MDCTVHGVAKSQAQLSNFHSDGKESACDVEGLGSIPELGRPLERGMAAHPSVLAWRIPWTEGLAGCSWAHRESDTTERLSFQVA